MDSALGFAGLLTAVVASQGFWTWIQSKSNRKNSTTTLLLGLAHDRIVFLGMSYVDRGWITKDEYEDFFKYLYTPYSEFGGNGLAEKVMLDVTKLPLRGSVKTEIQIVKEKHGPQH